MEGRRLSRPRHCNNGVQPVPKAVYRIGFYKKPATAHGGIQTLVLSHRRHVTARPLRSATSTTSLLQVSHFMHYTDLRLTYLLTYLLKIMCCLCDKMQHLPNCLVDNGRLMLLLAQRPDCICQHLMYKSQTPV